MAGEKLWAGKIVHLLRHGRTLCGMAGTPDQWPAKHWWVPDQYHKDVNCPKCLEKLPLASQTRTQKKKKP